MRRMSWCSRNSATKLLLSFWRWKKALVVLVLIGIPIIMQVQDYMETAYLKFLLENEFAESHTQLHRRLAEVPKGLVGSKIGGHDRRTKYLAGSKCFGGIQSMPKYSHWFRERFKANIELFLDKHDADNIRNLSHYVLPFGFKNENHELIRSLLRHENFKNPPLDLRLRTGTCITCAVVGSGGILNGSRLGAEIDSHDFVFRINAALTHGKYAQDVGSKTHFYAFFPESAHIQNVWDQNVTLIYTVYKTSDVDYAAKMLKISRPRTSEDVDFRRVKIMHPDFFRYSFARFLHGKSWRPTTGAVTVLLAVHLCDTVAVYGFGYDPRFTLYYYDKAFTRRPILPMLVHDVDNERKLWTKLHSERVIRYIQRDVE